MKKGKISNAESPYLYCSDQSSSKDGGECFRHLLAFDDLLGVAGSNRNRKLFSLSAETTASY